jgi:uncharacterized membrane protein HdeD (DUF308 family)
MLQHDRPYEVPKNQTIETMFGRSILVVSIRSAAHHHWPPCSGGVLEVRALLIAALGTFVVIDLGHASTLVTCCLSPMLCCSGVADHQLQTRELYGSAWAISVLLPRGARS